MASVADEWLYETLSGDVTLMALVEGVYDAVIPQEADLPAIQFQLQSATDTIGVGTARVLSSDVYLVRVVGRTGSYAALQTAADRMDTLLHGVCGVSVDNGTMLCCYREGQFKLAEVSDGLQYRHLGGFYRIQSE